MIARLGAGSQGICDLTASIIKGISKKPISPPKNASTATSFAALSTAGAVPRSPAGDRNAHIRVGHLRQHRTVFIMNHRVHNALRMNQDIDLRRL